MKLREGREVVSGVALVETVLEGRYSEVLKMGSLCTDVESKEARTRNSDRLPLGPRGPGSLLTKRMLCRRRKS